MQNIIKKDKKLKVFKERCDISNLKKQLKKVDIICKATGVKTSESTLDLTTQPISHSYDLAKEQLKFLRFVHSHPRMGVAEVYKRLKLSARKGNELRQALEGSGFVKVAEQKDQKGWKKTIQLTDLGQQAIKA